MADRSGCIPGSLKISEQSNASGLSIALPLTPDRFMPCMQDCMVGLLFAFMPVLASKPSDGMDNFEVIRLVTR